MEAIKPYRRYSVRLSLYFLWTLKPAELLQPVRQRDRGPPIYQTQHG